MMTLGRLLCMAGLLLAASPALAQDGAWRTSASAYLWFPQTTTNLSTRYGDVTTELSRSDAIDALDMGVMGTVTARNGRWALVADLIYLDLTLKNGMPRGMIFSNATTNIKLTSAAGYGLYTLASGSGATVEAGGGLRMMSTDIDLTLHGIGRPDYANSISDTWIDPVLALRISFDVTGPWSTSLWLDGGGFGIGEASKNTWQVVALATYRFNEAWSVSGGWRYLSADQESNGVPYDLELSGPVMGATFRF